MSGRDLGGRISQRLERHGVRPTPMQAQQLVEYLCLLAKWNSKINLTALPINPPTEAAIDRLLVEPFLAAQRISGRDQRVLDLGSGGGSPAVPMRIAAASLDWVMVESKVRKSAFLREVVRHLSLERVEVANARFEELLTRVDLHESADLVTVRAVRADQKLWRAAQAYLKPGGRVFWFTSAEEARPAILPPLSVETSAQLLPASGSQLVILRKR